jgi:Xaa-Pro aminopeptidase
MDDRPTSINLSPEALDSLLAGIAAAPWSDGRVGAADSWVALIADDLGPKRIAELRARIDARTDDAGGMMSPAERLAAVRAELARRQLDGFIVPLADEHQGEYVPQRARRLAWLTGFTGSAGLAVILARKAAVFVDGRYTLQAANEVDPALFEIRHLVDEPATDWIAANLPEGGRLGYDPWLHTADGAQRLRNMCQKKKAELAPQPINPVDAVWPDQPAPPLSPIESYGPDFAGATSADKRALIAKLLAKDNQDALVLTAPDSICWLANIRGADVPYTPFVLAFAILRKDASLDIFTDRRKLRASVEARLEAGIRIVDRNGFEPALDALGVEKLTVRADPSGAADAIFARLENAGAKIARAEDPCQGPKAKKNDVELDGMRAAHVRDGAALSKFLAWLAKEGPSGKLTEISAADRLEAFRRENDLIQGLSFPTISGAGPNGAIVHYRVSEASNRAIEPGTLYLVDSGAQYLDGTTDVTRTIAIGTPTDEMKDRFTRVLRGHIALAMAVFPAGTSGAQLDGLARSALWQAGLDYDHGTGHGVGNFLSVHEGPQRISKVPNRIALEPGMVVSNEPGYYETDAFGIRIENLVAVRPAPIQNAKPGGKTFYGFETITLAPIDLNLVEGALLTRFEVEWLNDYHARVRDVVGPLVDDETRAWLAHATRPI